PSGLAWAGPRPHSAQLGWRSRRGFSPKRSTIPAGGGALITLVGVGGMLTRSGDGTAIPDGVGVILVSAGAIDAGGTVGTTCGPASETFCMSVCASRRTDGATAM